MDLTQLELLEHAEEKGYLTHEEVAKLVRSALGVPEPVVETPAPRADATPASGQQPA